MDYTRQPVSVFIRGFILKTSEGWLFLGGSVLCVGWGLLLWLVPYAVPTPQISVQHLAIGFLLVPLFLAVVLVKFAQPEYRSSLLTNLMLLGAIALPFYVAYLR
jgi:hypothetical protein